MRALLAVVFLLLPDSALGAPPSGYTCAPGTAKKGVGCTCPKGYTEKRDAEDIALCAAPATPNVSSQIIALAKKDDLRGALELAKRYTFKEGDQTGLRLVQHYEQWTKPARDQLVLLGSRGQCNAVNKHLEKFEHWIDLTVAVLGKEIDPRFANDATDAFISTLDTHIEQLNAHHSNCLATASKDDNSAVIVAARNAHLADLEQCFTSDLPELKTPLTIKVVVDADGTVAATTITSVWPDLDLKITNAKLEAYRRKLITERERCFATAIGKWTFKPNARGFAGTITVPRAK